jgi:hypothetical protein
VIAPTEASVMKAISEESQWLLTHLASPLPSAVIARRIRALLREKGFLHGKRVDFEAVRDRVRAHWSEPVLARLHCEIVHEPGDWLASTTYASRAAHRHPLEDILLLRGLGSSLSEIFTIQDEVVAEEPPLVRVEFHEKPTSAWEQRLFSLVTDERFNLTEIAGHLGVTRSTVKSHAHRLGIWRAGWKLDQASRPRVARLHCDPKLLKAFVAQRERRRGEWTELLEKSPAASRWELQQLDVRNYDRLRENDREWFDGHLPPPKRRLPRASDDWKLRDRELLARAQKLVAELLAVPEPVRVTQHAVVVGIGVLHLFSGWKQQLPLTVAYVPDAVETGPAYVARKLRWALGVLQSEGARVTPVQLLRRAGMDRSRGTYKWEIAEAVAASHRMEREIALPSLLR